MTTWVILAGLPATGKSTLAHALAERLDAVTLDKDRIRNAIFGEALTDYTREQDDLVMRAMLEAARYLTGRKRVEFILFDGRTFSRNAQIDAVIGAAEAARSGVADSPSELLRQDCGGAPPAWSARSIRHGIAIWRSTGKSSKSFEPIPYAKLDIDTTQGFETQAGRDLSYLAMAAVLPRKERSLCRNEQASATAAVSRQNRDAGSGRRSRLVAHGTPSSWARVTTA